MKRLFVAWLLISLGMPLARATDKDSLRGVKAFGVLVEEVQGPEELRTSDFQTDVELRCREAGIKLDNSALDYLYIEVHALQVQFEDGRPTGRYALAVSVEFRQWASLVRDPSIHAFAATWSAGGLGTVSSRDLRSFSRESVRDKVEKFLNAFLEQNPK